MGHASRSDTMAATLACPSSSSPIRIRSVGPQQRRPASAASGTSRFALPSARSDQYATRRDRHGLRRHGVRNCRARARLPARADDRLRTSPPSRIRLLPNRTIDGRVSGVSASSARRSPCRSRIDEMRRQALAFYYMHNLHGERRRCSNCVRSSMPGGGPCLGQDFTEAEPFERLSGAALLAALPAFLPRPLETESLRPSAPPASPTTEPALAAVSLESMER